MFLVYGGDLNGELRVTCNTPGYETDADDIKFQTWYVYVLNGGAIDWKNDNHSTTAMSSTEAEYIVASETAMEAVLIRMFIDELRFVLINKEPMEMYRDNSGAIILASETGV